MYTGTFKQPKRMKGCGKVYNVTLGKVCTYMYVDVPETVVISLSSKHVAMTKPLAPHRSCLEALK